MAGPQDPEVTAHHPPGRRHRKYSDAGIKDRVNGIGRCCRVSKQLKHQPVKRLPSQQEVGGEAHICCHGDGVQGSEFVQRCLGGKSAHVTSLALLRGPCVATLFGMPNFPFRRAKDVRRFAAVLTAIALAMGVSACGGNSLREKMTSPWSSLLSPFWQTSPRMLPEISSASNPSPKPELRSTAMSQPRVTSGKPPKPISFWTMASIWKRGFPSSWRTSMYRTQ